MTRRLTQSILLCDLLVANLALLSSYYLRSIGGPYPPTLPGFFRGWWPVILAVTALWTVLFVRMKLDGFRRGWDFPTVASQLMLAVALLITVMFAIGFLGHQLIYSRLILLYFGFLALIGFVAVRCCVRSLLSSRTRSGATRRAVILGNGTVARELATKIERHPELMLQLVGFLYPGGPEGAAAPEAPVEESYSVTSFDVIDLLRTAQVEELFVALPDPSVSETRKLIGLCRREGFHVSLVPQWYELYVSKARLVELGGLPMISLENHSPSPLTFVFKRVMDLVLASAMLALVSPVLALVAAALFVRRGEAFKFEVRCGKHGSPFHMYRLNIDRQEPETLVGYERLLAQLSLTELPQLWNVLMGDMALVGPRPEVPERVRHYSDWQRQRLAVPPGLTGLAQVNGLRDQHSSEEKARFDIQYIYHVSPLLDLSLIIQTAWTLAARLWRPTRLAPAAQPFAAPTSPPLTEVMHANSSHSCAD